MAASSGRNHPTPCNVLCICLWFAWKAQHMGRSDGANWALQKNRSIPRSHGIAASNGRHHPIPCSVFCICLWFPWKAQHLGRNNGANWALQKTSPFRDVLENFVVMVSFHKQASVNSWFWQFIISSDSPHPMSRSFFCLCFRCPWKAQHLGRNNGANWALEKNCPILP